jgi:hypothetical protein
MRTLLLLLTLLCTPAISLAQLRYTEIGDGVNISTTSNNDIRFAIGDHSVVLNNRSAIANGLSAKTVPQLSQLLAGTAPTIFAKYSATEAQLTIDIVKTERSIISNDRTTRENKVRLYTARFTPAGGEIYARHKLYGGNNPFARFTGNGDGVFHNISWQGALVAIGHAMKQSNAAWAVVADLHQKVNRWDEDCGNLLRSCTEYHFQGQGWADWYIALPSDLTATGISAAICATDQAPCPTDKAVLAGISLLQVKPGGTFSTAESELFHDTKKVSGLSVLAGIALSFAIGYIVGPTFLSQTAVDFITQGFGFSSNVAAGIVNATSSAFSQLVVEGKSLSDIGSVATTVPFVDISFGNGSAANGGDKYEQKAIRIVHDNTLAPNLANGTGNAIATVATTHERTRAKPSTHKERRAVESMKQGIYPCKSLNPIDLDGCPVFDTTLPNYTDNSIVLSY